MVLFPGDGKTRNQPPNLVCKGIENIDAKASLQVPESSD
jgi:hypothetical protein